MSDSKPQTVLDDILDELADAVDVAASDEWFDGNQKSAQITNGIKEAKQALQELILSWLPEERGQGEEYDNDYFDGYTKAIQEMKQNIVKGFKK